MSSVLFIVDGAGDFVVQRRRAEAESRVVAPRESLDGRLHQTQLEVAVTNQPSRCGAPMLQPRTSHSHQIRAVEISPTFGAGNKLACLTLQPQQPTEHRLFV